MGRSRFRVLVVLASFAVFVLQFVFGFVAQKEKGFIFTQKQAALWAALFLLLVTCLLDWFVAQSQGAADVAAGAATARTTAAANPGDTTVAADAATKSTAERRLGMKALVIGADGRASTSKLQAVLWTGAVLYALTFLLLAGRVLIAPSHCGGASEPACVTPDLSALRGAFDKVVKDPLKAEYFALLGFPLAGAVAAKALISGKVANGDLLKQPSGGSGVVTGIAEVVTNDTGSIDVLDFQYAAFNLLTLLYFFVQFFTHLEDGLPSIPATLLALSGVSVTAYTTKKALETGVGPQITSVSAPTILLTTTSTLTVIGSGFVSAGGGSSELNGLFLAGIPLDATAWTATRVTATLPTAANDLVAKGFAPTNPADLVVQDEAGQTSGAYQIEIRAVGDWPP